MWKSFKTEVHLAWKDKLELLEVPVSLELQVSPVVLVLKHVPSTLIW